MTESYLDRYIRKKKKRAKRNRAAALALTFFAVIFLLLWTTGLNKAETAGTVETPPAQVAETYIFRAEPGGTPVNWQETTTAWAAEAGMEKRYDLTDGERWEVASVVTAEAVGEPFAGKVAVAQCILQTCEDEGLRPSEALVVFGYSDNRPDPCEEALEAVQAVFDFGHVASAEPIKYFYAPARVTSKWHESQVYVMTINGHKFFKEAA